MKWLSIALTIVISFAVGLQAEAAKRRPNILLVVTDDQAPFDLRAYDPKSRLDTPVLDRLARDGMVIENAYHMGSFRPAVCTVSRHMLMSGRTVWHLPIGPGNGKHSPDNLEDSTLAAVFNDAGYGTMRTCKPGNSYRAADHLFSVVKDSMKREGNDPGGSAWHADQVIDYLKEREAKRDERPFLIFLGFSHPHDPRNGKPEYLKKYGAVNHTDEKSLPPSNPAQPPVPRNYLSAHPFPNGHTDVRDEIEASGVWKNRDPQTIRNEQGREFACSENIDSQIGRVLNKLQALGELDNTYIIYTSDHGIAIGRHGLQGKQNLYEHSWRVPLIVKGPGIKPGSRATGNVYLHDLLATLCDLTGVKAPETNEGTSFRSVLDGKQDKIRDVLYGVYCGGAKPGMRSVRKGDWKLIKYDAYDGKVRKTQLFNLADNPDELLEEHAAPDIVRATGHKPSSEQRNLASDPKYAKQEQELEALLLEEMRRHHDPYRFWNQPDDGLQPPKEEPVRKRRKQSTDAT